jgi:hypothetical protein
MGCILPDVTLVHREISCCAQVTPHFAPPWALVFDHIGRSRAIGPAAPWWPSTSGCCWRGRSGSDTCRWARGSRFGGLKGDRGRARGAVKGRAGTMYGTTWQRPAAHTSGMMGPSLRASVRHTVRFSQEHSVHVCFRCQTSRNVCCLPYTVLHRNVP